MSESVVDRLSGSDDIDHVPSKKIKLDSASSEQSDRVQSHNSNTNTTPAEPAEPEQEDDIFDPVQAILDAGRRCKEEEEERRRNEDAASNEDSEEEPSEVGGNDENETGKDAGAKKRKKKKKKNANFRKNIKDILKPDQLDDLTIAARKEEEERRQRMNLKLQQLQQIQQQQQQLRLLEQQQSQLLRESLTSSSTHLPGSFRSLFDDSHSPRFNDGLMKKLIRKKHITVSLDGKQKGPSDDDCILLSSDEETETPEKSSFAYLNESFQSRPSHMEQLEQQFRNEAAKAKEVEKWISEEVIALSSGDEGSAENGSLPSLPVKPCRRMYNEATVGKAGVVDSPNGRSGGLDSDDDCVIISPEPEGEEEVEEKDECSQDLLNVPDHLGRVLINVGHPQEDEDIFLPSQIAKIVKPHQIGGIRFLYDNVVESKERYSETSGFGCILAHAMGLGKTLQTVSFCDAFLRTVGKTVLIIVPINTIQNWLNEFNKYLPSRAGNACSDSSYLRRRSMKAKFGKKEAQTKTRILDDENPTNANPEISEDLSLNLSFDSTLNLTPESSQCNIANQVPELSAAAEASQGPTSGPTESSPPTSESVKDLEIQTRTFDVFLLNETVKSLQARENAISTWSEKGGVLLIGYEMYRMLALKKLKKSTRKAMTLVHEERMAEAESLDKIYECLVDPGPNCVICDEGHRIKNSGAGISQALKAIKTKRRVVLTGYPLQNNLMEYWCMVDFVRPNYLGTKAEFSNMFERPIQNGQCADSTYEDKRIMKYRSHVLHSLLEGFVQRRSHVVLKNALPQKEEWVFLVKLTQVQLKIYKEFIRYLRDDLESDNASANPIKAFAVCCKIWNHPDVLWNVVKKNLDLEMDLDLDEVRPAARPNKPRRGTGRPRGRPPLNGISLPTAYTDPFDDGDHPILMQRESSMGRSESSGISLEWAKPLFENYSSELMENGVKFELLFQLIEETVSVGDKLLVFSQSLLTLDLIEFFLKKRLDWKKFVDYVRLDGSTAGLEREKLINEFNTSKIQKLFIISTRAGSLGINLVGANRVCIFDASWNPCHDSQAVCRVYRYGQTKPCHIYRFVADCTLEKRIYDRQVSKKGMADRIVDEMNPNTPFKSKDVSSFLVLQHDLLEKLPFIKCELNMDKFTDPVIRNVLCKMEDKITQEPFEHESLLIDQKHQKLSKSEKRLALKNYEKEKNTVANSYATYTRPSYAQYYSATTTSSNSSSSYSSYPSSNCMSGYNDSRSLSTSSNHMDINNGRLGGSPDTYRGSMGNATFDKFELHIHALKTRGIQVFPVELHQDTFLKDPTGAQDLFLKCGEKVYILVSQKGTYLRVQGKLLRVPFVGTEMTQDQAERFVRSLLHISSKQSHRRRRHHHAYSYPAEQQLPPSNSMLYQKNANHLQITNSRNNSGGDVMMGSSWSSRSIDSQQHHQPQQDLPADRSPISLVSPPPPSQMSSPYLTGSYPFPSHPDTSSNGVGRLTHHSAQTDLQNLSRLTETFCHRSSPYSSESSKQWMPSSLTSPHESASVSSPPVDMEVIKLHPHHSTSNSSNSNSSSSRTESPYNKQNWNNNNKSSDAGGTSGCGNNTSTTEDSSFYTDFTITRIKASNNATNSFNSTSSRRSDKCWEGGNSNNLPSLPGDFFRSKQPPSSLDFPLVPRPDVIESMFNNKLSSGISKSPFDGASSLSDMTPTPQRTDFDFLPNIARFAASSGENSIESLLERSKSLYNNLFSDKNPSNF